MEWLVWAVGKRFQGKIILMNDFIFLTMQLFGFIYIKLC